MASIQKALLRDNLLTTQEAAEYSRHCGYSIDRLWQLCERDYIARICTELDTVEEIETDIQKKTAEVIVNRRKSLSNHSLTEKIRGRYLGFYPSVSMFDGLAESVSNGFYDYSDAPPLGLWIAFNEHCLISFIPEELMAMATLGIDGHASGCLEWIGESLK